MAPEGQLAAVIDDLRARDIEGLLAEAWRVREEHWPPVLHASTPSPHTYISREHANRPGAWAQFSVTGRTCALGCDHCNGRVLDLMETAPPPEGLVSECRQRVEEDGLEGVLLSGGSSLDGTVPLGAYLGAMAELKAMGLGVIVHTGLVDRELAGRLARAGVDLAMTDVIGSRDVARGVCHLDRGPGAWRDTLAELRGAGVPIAPHIVAGLDRGRVDSEYTALEVALEAGPAQVVIIVLSPMAGTPMEGLSPPAPEEVARLGAVARIASPSVPLALGCVKPSGTTRPALERSMVDAGVGAVAYPLPATLEHARSRGLSVTFDDRCCALLGLANLTGRP